MSASSNTGLIKSIGLVSVLSAIFFSANYGIVRHVEVDSTNISITNNNANNDTNDSIIANNNSTDTISHTMNKRKKQKRTAGANHVDVKTVRRKHNNNNNAASSERKKYKRSTAHREGAPYHDNAVLIVHYHKTGYVLSRELMFLLHQIEHDLHDPTSDDGRRGSIFEVSGTDPDTGVRFAFDGVGNWQKSAFSTRKHDKETKCPVPAARRPGKEISPETTGFKLRDGTVYVQESPDLFCDDDDLIDGLAASHSGGTKIIHFVRNPYEMVLSNYFYHSQDPTPEKWVHKDDPCEHNYGDGESLSSHVVPTLSREFNVSQHRLNEQFDGIRSMCHDIFRSKHELKNATFFQHLVRLDKYDGLRLSAAQMIAASGVSNGRMAGGDVLRMANNLIRFRRLQQSLSPERKIQVLTVTMGDFIENMSQGTYDFFDFILGANDTTIPKHVLREAAVGQEEKYARKKKRKHVTQTNEEDQKIKSGLMERLRGDSDLSFILNMTEELVYEALSS